MYGIGSVVLLLTALALPPHLFADTYSDEAPRTAEVVLRLTSQGDAPENARLGFVYSVSGPDRVIDTGVWLCGPVFGPDGGPPSQQYDPPDLPDCKGKGQVYEWSTKVRQGSTFQIRVGWAIGSELGTFGGSGRIHEESRTVTADTVIALSHRWDGSGPDSRGGSVPSDMPATGAGGMSHP